MRPCWSCGASLEASHDGIACPRCGADAPGVAGAAAPRGAPAPAPGPSRATKVLLAVAMAAVGIGFAVMFFARVKPPQEPAPRARPLSTQLDALCFVDANGDDAPDPVLWQDGKTRGRVVAVDGRSGQGIWASREIEEPDALACPDPNMVLAAGATLRCARSTPAPARSGGWRTSPGSPTRSRGATAAQPW